MKRIVCFHCGEHFDAKRPVCPHCGADRDLTHAETPTEVLEQEWSASDDSAYQAFLEREGLVPRKPPGPVSKKALAWVILATLAISGLILLLL